MLLPSHFCTHQQTRSAAEKRLLPAGQADPLVGHEHAASQIASNDSGFNTLVWCVHGTDHTVGRYFQSWELETALNAHYGTAESPAVVAVTFTEGKGCSHASKVTAVCLHDNPHQSL